MTRPIHEATQHRSAIAGVEARTLTSARAFPRHAHDQFGIGVLTDGAQRSWSGIGPVESARGDIIMVNPGEIHDGVPIDGRPRTWRMLYFDPALVSAEIEGEDIRTEIARPTVRDEELRGLFGRLFARATDTTAEADSLAREEDLLRTVMLVLRRHGPSPVTDVAHSRSHSHSPGVARARQRLDSAPDLPASLAELARLAGVSRFQLLRAFAREVGTTPHAYLLQRRVRLARQWLAAGRSPAAAALHAGFADQSHLTRAFVRQLGVTPARYRAAFA